MLSLRKCLAAFLAVVPLVLTAGDPGLPVVGPSMVTYVETDYDNEELWDTNREMYNGLEEKFDSLRLFYPHGYAASVLSPLEYYLFMNSEIIFDDKPAWSTEPWGCSWYCGGWPDSIHASSTLPPSAKYDYKAENIHDRDLRTAWVEGSDGDGRYESITVRFAADCPPVTTLEIYNGYMRTPQTWSENSRVKTFRMYLNGSPYALLELEDDTCCQHFIFEELKQLGEELEIKLEIVDIYPGSKYTDVAVSEINFDGTGVHCFGAGTQILTPSGAIGIEELTYGDIILSLDADTGMIQEAEVISVVSSNHHNLYELVFDNGTEVTVTDDHPFYYDGRFYSLVPNNKYGVQTLPLETGQEIYYLGSSSVTTLKLVSARKVDGCLPAYAVTGLSQNSLYFAEGLCVAVE